MFLAGLLAGYVWALGSIGTVLFLGHRAQRHIGRRRQREAVAAYVQSFAQPRRGGSEMVLLDCIRYDAVQRAVLSGKVAFQQSADATIA